MKDENLIKAIKFFGNEAASRSRDPWSLFRKGLMIPCKSFNVRDSRKKTDIFLQSLTADELNDLCSVVMFGSYDKYRKNEPAWIRAKSELSFGDYAALRRRLSYKRMTGKDCIKYLRGCSAERTSRLLIEYLNMEPITKRQRDLIRDVNESRITDINDNRIEVR